MKNLKKLSVALMLALGTTFAMTSCGDAAEAEAHGEETTTGHEAPEEAAPEEAAPEEMACEGGESIDSTTIEEVAPEEVAPEKGH